MDLESTADLLGLDREQLVGGLNLVQASRVLGIAPSTLRQRALDGRIGCQRDGRAWRFFFWHLQDYLDRRERPVASAGTGRVREEAVGSRKASASSEYKGDVLVEAKELGLIT